MTDALDLTRDQSALSAGDAARASVRGAALNADRAHSRGAPGPSSFGQPCWQADLIDFFELHGRCYIVARLGADGGMLSKRELQVLAYAERGMSNKEIAYDLGLSVSSVATYLARLRRKLGVDTRVALLRRGLSRSAALRDVAEHPME